MNIDRIVLLFAGTLNLTGLALGYFVHPLWLLLSVFVGLNLLQASFTRFCPAAIILKKFGIKPGNAFE
jgi:hypothetical protein